jgi:2-polyprenyl-3-methyl-5-hydroxy-6-metoxy-1,4-benzoquinol methylase
VLLKLRENPSKGVKVTSGDNNNSHTSSVEYDSEWIRDTWGWDTPEEFIRSQGRNLRPRVRYCIEIADLQAGMKILDIGCGRGEVVLHCARQGIHAVGVDYSREVLSIAQAALDTHTLEEQHLMKFICDDVKNIISEGPFDRIFMLDLVEHLHDWELNELLQHCRKLLKPEGQIIIHTLPNRWLYEITYRRILRLAMPWLPVDPRSEKEKTIHINEMSITHLHRLLMSNGLKCRIWLHDLIVDQARWHSQKHLQDKREGLYKWMRNPLIATVFRLLNKTPLRLLLTNDIFAVAVSQDKPLAEKNIPNNRTESFMCRISK